MALRMGKMDDATQKIYGRYLGLSHFGFGILLYSRVSAVMICSFSFFASLEPANYGDIIAIFWGCTDINQ